MDEFLVDAEGLEDVAELEHAALGLRAPFDALGAPCAVAADLALALERRDDVPLTRQSVGWARECFFRVDLVT